MAVRAVVVLGLLLVAAVAWMAARVFMRRLGPSRESGVPLAVFRMFFSAVLLGELMQMYRLVPWISDSIPFLETSEFGLRHGLLVWMGVVACLGLGLFTRIAAAVNFAFNLVTFSTFHLWEYHVDYIYTVVAVFLLVAPVSARLSLDRLRETLRWSGPKGDHLPDGTVSSAWTTLLVLWGIGFAYADSVLYKLDSSLWRRGLGVWLPASLPHATWTDLGWFLDYEFPAKAAGYLVLAFESAFLFVLWWRRTWPVLALVGIVFHAGIVVAFPIPTFGLAVLAIYLAMIPAEFYRRLAGTLLVASPRLLFAYDKDCPLCRRTRLAILHFDLRGTVEFLPIDEARQRAPALAAISREAMVRDVHGVARDGRVLRGVALYREVLALAPWTVPLGWILALPGASHVAESVYARIAASREREHCSDDSCEIPPPSGGPPPAPAWRTALAVPALALLFAAQIVSSSDNPLLGAWVKGTAFVPTYEMWTGFASVARQRVSRPFLGVIRHPVFLDIHFLGTRDVLAVEYVRPDGGRTLLPLVRADGLVHPWCSGRVWVYWNFRVVPLLSRPEDLLVHIRKITAYWAVRRGVSLEDAEFVVLRKRFAVTDEWERGRLDRLRALPWEEIGRGTWEKRKFRGEILEEKR